MSVVVGCSELVQSAVSPGGPTEGLLKVCLDRTIYDSSCQGEGFKAFTALSFADGD